MKNVLVTLLLLILVFAAGFGAFALYKKLVRSPELRAGQDVAAEIETRIGIPFLEAWALRDLDKMSLICRGEFEASVPEYAEWTTIESLPFEVKTRFCGEEQANSIDSFDEIFSYFFDPISGLTDMQTEFSVSHLNSVKGDNLWHGRVNLEARGFDQEGFAQKYSAEGFAVFSIPAAGSSVPASMRAWEYISEVHLTSKVPILDDLRSVLTKELTDLDPQAHVDRSSFCFDIADIDNDQDQDIAVSWTIDSGTLRGIFFFDGTGYSNQWNRVISGVNAQSNDSNSRTVWLDLNRDRKPDLLLGNRFYENRGVDNETNLVDITERFGAMNDNGSDSSAPLSLGKIRRSIQR